ncbi:MAG: heme o synthase [Flavobacteriaceae bacterium]|nr:heme o synthase [Flavobacteriaceae bacterium]
MEAVTSIKIERSAWYNFSQITKFRLSVSVVISALAGYLLGTTSFSWVIFGLLFFGGYCLVGASNVFNQIIECDLDAKMDRTKNRPLPLGSMSVQTALFLGFILLGLGLVALYFINPKTAMFGAISVFLYTSAYTPLKTVTPLSVFVGAFPGAIPFMLGWVAATGDFGIEAGTLFMIQFFWQFPHFWAIGWCMDDDYKKAGFKMLPTNKKDKSTALQIVLYTIWTILASMLPAFGITGQFQISIISAVLVLLLGFGFLYYALKLFRERSNAAARRLLFVSIIYITLLQMIYVIDKFITI